MVKSLTALHKEVWVLQSKYVCLRDNKCVTCGSEKNPQAGHFVHGKCMDFVEKNIHRQCARCNFYLQGNLINYADFIITTYGIKTFNELKVMKASLVGKPESEADLLAIKAKIEKKIKNLAKKASSKAHSVKVRG
jgi:hypothetical protein